MTSHRSHPIAQPGVLEYAGLFTPTRVIVPGSFRNTLVRLGGVDGWA